MKLTRPGLPAPRRLAIGAALALLSTLLWFVPYASGLLDRPEWILQDHRMHWLRKDTPAHAEIAIVLIDEPSLQALEPRLGRFPWPRSVYADLLQYVVGLGGAEAVVFDVLFSEHQRDVTAERAVSDHDRRLAQDTADFGNVVHASQIHRETVDESMSPLLNRPLPEGVAERFGVRGASGFPPSGANAWYLPFEGLRTGAGALGVVGMTPDADGAYRRVSLFFEYQGTVMPGLSLAPLLMRWKPQAVRYAPGHVDIDEVRIPLDREGRYLVNMVGTYPTYSFAGIWSSWELVQRGEVDKLLIDPGEFAGKIVFVGANAVGLEDLKATAISPVTPGVYIHASTLTNILDHDFLVPPRPVATVAAGLLLAALTATFALRRGRLILQALVPAVLAATYVGAALLAQRKGLMIELVAPLFAIGWSWMFTTGWVVWSEQKDRRRVSRMLEQYVSPAILGEVMKSYGDFMHAEVGRRAHVSILFSDIRGFTNLSETMDPEKVVDLLNTYFSAMTEVIFQQRGTVDKFIGDAIMAFWGAPIPDEEHARHAVSAALGMQAALVGVNVTLAERGYPAVRTGIGVHTGDVVLGNVGSERKLDYTIIGDNVNLASRLEGLTKMYGQALLITEATRAALGEGWPCVTVDAVRVKGKTHPVRIYAPLGLPDHPEAPAMLQRSQLSARAFDAYLARDWDLAQALYTELADPALLDLFGERCRAYAEAPPEDGWDGVYTLHTK